MTPGFVDTSVMERARRAAIALIASVALCTSHVSARAQSEPSTPRSSTAPSADFEVHEWLILVCDAYQPQANSAATLETTLPDFIDTRRRRAPATQQSRLSPVGVIRLIGSTDAKVDVKIDIPSGRLMSTWPKASVRSASVLWRDLSFAPEPARLQPIEAGHWLGMLRTATSANLTADGRSEQFLLYDVELNYPTPLKLGGGATRDDPIQLANTGSAPLHDVMLYRPEIDGAGWRTAMLSELAPGRKLPPATAPTTAPSTVPTGAPATQLTTSSPVASTSLGVDSADIKELRLMPTLTTQPREFLGEWKERLTRLGVASDDLDLIVKTLEQHGLDEKRLTAVYRMDDSELDRLLPLEVLPQPKKTMRVALVIVKNADPAVPAEIDGLIAQLGDRDWRKREEASKLLLQIGPAARNQLQAALKNTDPEIVLRAERLIKLLEKR